MLEIKDDIQFDKSLFGYFNICFLVNKVLAKYNFFLKFFERRDKFKFLIKKKIKGKNKVSRNLSVSVIENFNGCEIIKHEFVRKEKIDFVPIEIVYEPIYDDHVPVPCYFTDQVHLAYRSYTGKNNKGKEKVIHYTVRQCPYCETLFVKSDENFKKYIKVCDAKEGITSSFNNGEILFFQDKFKYLSDVQFTVYIDFETTIGDTVILIQKCLL